MEVECGAVVITAAWGLPLLNTSVENTLSAMETLHLWGCATWGVVWTWPPQKRGGDCVLLMEMDTTGASEALMSSGEVTPLKVAKAVEATQGVLHPQGA